MTVIMKDIISIRGERQLWLEFSHKLRKEKKTAWQVLQTFLRKYIQSDQETRVLLMLFPSELVDQLLETDEPDELLVQAVRKELETEK